VADERDTENAGNVSQVRWSAAAALRSVIMASTAGFVLAACGTTSPAAQDPSTRTSAPSATSDPGAPQRLLDEVQRELTAMRSTRYQHSTHVDEHTGTYFYDCSGLVDYAARRVIPADADALPTSTSVRPLAGDIEHHLHEGLVHTVDGWTAIRTVAELRPGDVIAWLATEDSTTGDTGHTMIVFASPTTDPAHPGEWLVRVADSTLHPHAQDSRQRGDTGLGTGTIGLLADPAGLPTGFYWQGGVSREAKSTEVALGRPD
jgi:hypothetical protein